MVSKYLVFNGEVVPAEGFGLSLANRAFRYADSLFETIHVNGTRMQFFDRHINRLYEGMNILSMEAHPALTIEKLSLLVRHLLNANKQLKGVRLRLTVFRNDGGFYTPQTNATSFIIESEPLDEADYVLNAKGFKLGIYKQVRKPVYPLSSFKTGNAQVSVLAGIYKNENGFDDCLFLNEHGHLCEAISSNFFLVKKGVLITPSLSEGCVAGVMRDAVIDIALKTGYSVFDDAIIHEKDLLDADELFLTNAINGLRWVVAFQNRRYYSYTAKRLVKALNETAFPGS